MGAWVSFMHLQCLAFIERARLKIAAVYRRLSEIKQGGCGNWTTTLQSCSLFLIVVEFGTVVFVVMRM